MPKGVPNHKYTGEFKQQAIKKALKSTYDALIDGIETDESLL